MHIIYTQKSLIYILVYYYGVHYSNNISCIHTGSKILVVYIRKHILSPY